MPSLRIGGFPQGIGDSHSIRIATSSTWRSCDIILTDTAEGITSTGVTFRAHTGDANRMRGFSVQEFTRPRAYIAYGKVVRYQEGRTKGPGFDGASRAGTLQKSKVPAFLCLVTSGDIQSQRSVPESKDHPVPKHMIQACAGKEEKR